MSMWEMIAGLPAQYSWAAGVAPPEVQAAGSVLVCGMGGSGISGDYAALVAGERGYPVQVHKSYGLPAWVEAVRPVVVAVSYSGDTEETISSVEAARAAGLAVGVVTGGGRLGELARAERWAQIEVPGGLEPRAALGYLAGGVLRIVQQVAGLGGIEDDLEEAAQLTGELLGDDGPAHPLARDLASGLAGKVAVVWGSSGPAAVAAQRWKTQINENAKTPAYWSLIPELNHNEVMGWSAARDASRHIGVIALRDREEHPQVSRRFELTSEIIRGAVEIVGEVWSQGRSALARAASLSLIGDLVSVHLAEMVGVDPVPVDAISELKQRLEG
jgi:glucose/mannose-6-phosphate isomerase